MRGHAAARATRSSAMTPAVGMYWLVMSVVIFSCCCCGAGGGVGGEGGGGAVALPFVGAASPDRSGGGRELRPSGCVGVWRLRGARHDRVVLGDSARP